MIKLKAMMVISLLLLTGCSTSGYYNNTAISYCNGDIYLNCEWGNK